uniref:CSON000819 protein n=1 Tax=Culicoides sonorensis TaxID=179676 RepID=A0A336MJQ8_CULSO
MEQISAHVKQSVNGTLTFKPKKGDICASKFFPTVKVSDLLELPHSLRNEPAYALQFKLAYVELPTDDEDKKEALNVFVSEVLEKKVNLQLQYR